MNIIDKNIKLQKVEAMKNSFIKNSKQAWLVGMMTGCIIFSSSNIYKNISLNHYNYDEEYHQEIEQNYTKPIIKLDNKSNIPSIYVNEYLDNTNVQYFIKNNYLYKQDNNIVNLKDSNYFIEFSQCNINNELLQNISLIDSNVKSLTFNTCSIDNSSFNFFPKTLEELSLKNCNYVTNLNNLVLNCPNIKMLCLNNNCSLSDFSFLDKLPYLEKIYINESPYITEELINYLNDKGIKHNLTEKDINISKKVDNIISNIIKPNMDDKAKIQAVCLYVLNNLKYDYELGIQSNEYPLSLALNEGKGVCTSYSYLTSVLLNKANIESFEILNKRHAWNMVKLDNKYYYIDSTNIDNSDFYNFLLKTLNITKYYMLDTNNTNFTSMSIPKEVEVIIPYSLIEDIEKGRDQKNIIEKYSGEIGNIAVILGYILYGIIIGLGGFSIINFKEQTTKLFKDIKKNYNEEIATKML